MKAQPIKRQVTRFRRYMIAGLLVWIPLAATILVIALLVDIMDQTLVLIPQAYRPENLLGFPLPGAGVVLSLAIVFVTGVAVVHFFGRKVVALWEAVLDRIPLVRSIYSAVKKVSETVLGDEGKSFREVVLIEYPRKGVWSLAFKTTEDLGEVQARTGKHLIGVFVPTTPNPTSGFIILVPEEDAVVLDMTVEEGLQMVISLGVVTPQWHGETPPRSLAQPEPGT